MRSAVLLALLLSSPALGGEPTAEEMLKLHDKAHSNFNDLVIESKMIIREPGKSEGRTFEFTTSLKGEDKRLVIFKAPGDYRGMGMLTEGRDTMYVYLPGFQKVRRMGIHLKGQSFAGSDMSYEDMNESTYGGSWAPKYVGADEKSWILELTLLPGKEAEFPKLKVWVDRKIHQANRIEYYDAKGQKARTSARDEWVKDDGPVAHYSPRKLVMTDHRRNDHSTEIVITSAKVNSGVPDSLFSQRTLVKGN